MNDSLPSTLTAPPPPPPSPSSPSQEKPLKKQLICPPIEKKCIADKSTLKPYADNIFHF